MNGTAPEMPEFDDEAIDALGDELTGVRKVAAPASTTSPPRWETLWIEAPRDWYTTAPAARRWLFRDARLPGSPGVFPLGKAGQIVAQGGIGKTMLVCSLARAIAAGSKWLGSFQCTEPGAVLLVLGEEDADEAHRRLFNVARVDGAAPEGSIVVVPLAGETCAMLERDALGNPLETAFTSWLRSKVASRDDWRLIVIDPMSRFAGLDAEKDAALGTRFVQLRESFTSPTCSVLVSHHTPQTSRGRNAVEDPRGRGVTSVFDGFRWQAALVGEEVNHGDRDVNAHLREVITLRFTKSNYSRRPEPLLLRRDERGALVPLDDVDREMLDEARSGASTRAEREADRERVRVERDAAEAQRRAARAAEREADRRKRDDDDDAAVRDAMQAHEGVSVRELVALVKAARACGSSRALDAIHRVRGDR